MKRGGKPFWGIVLVALGVLMILNQLNLFRFSWIWGFSAPVILFVIAFFFVAGFLSKGPSAAGLLVPAGILGGIGLTLLLGGTFGLMYYVWPGFILSPAIGLLLLYLFGHEHSPGLLVPIGVLVTVAGTCFLSTVLRMWHILWPGFILAPAIGLLLLYWFGERQNRGLLIPISILGGISFFGFFGTFLMGNYGYGKYGLALVLILIGLMTLLKKPGEAKRPFKWAGRKHSEDTTNPEDARLRWEEARSHQQWHEYGQQAYREYDERFNNPDWARTDTPADEEVDLDEASNPYVNSDYSHNPQKR